MTQSLMMALVYCYATGLLVAISASAAFDYWKLETRHPGSATRVDVVSSFAAWDGEWYVKIASRGYDWDRERMSSVAFFPAYPALGAAVKWLTGWRTEWALLVVTHAALLGCFCLLGSYVAERFGGVAGSGTAGTLDLQEYSLVALGLFPTTFWMRMCYTESLFLLVCLLAMWGMQRGWRPWRVAAVIGFATATRSAGVALLPVFWWWLWRERERPGAETGCVSRGAPFGTAARQSVAYLPLCVWGLLGYMLFLYLAFGEPLAFMQTQQHWDGRRLAGWDDQLWKLITLEPFWSVYVPSSPCYWGWVPPHDNPLFNLRFWNPIYVLLTIGLLVVGARKRWLNARELLLAAGLLAIPLWFQAARACMMSQARYASVIFPVYIMMGHILTRLPGPLVGLLCALSGTLLAIYTALFVSWYWFF